MSLTTIPSQVLEAGAEDAAGVPSIGYVQGASGKVVQAVIRAFGLSLLNAGIDVLGMTEVPGAEVGGDAVMRDLQSRSEFDLYQSLGRGSQSCSLDSVGLTEAAGFLEATLHPGADLLIINKFGKEESLGRGFSGAFRKAMLLDIPLLTSVNPVFETDWQAFTGGLAQRLPPSVEAISAWWQSQRRAKD
ncbi:DUF2478 domain-containing protein [Aestuariivirga sp.]|uniref:DUF2478 domain-containing protein n=1 Tax=Aestuariivirga sp. TaxID=2650926 RepID=UPI0039E5E813